MPCARFSGGSRSVAPVLVSSQCPYCGEPIELHVDEAAGGSTQRQVEDCEVCCRPIDVSVFVDEDGEVSVDVQREDA